MDRQIGERERERERERSKRKEREGRNELNKGLRKIEKIKVTRRE